MILFNRKPTILKSPKRFIWFTLDCLKNLFLCLYIFSCLLADFAVQGIEWSPITDKSWFTVHTGGIIGLRNFDDRICNSVLVSTLKEFELGKIFQMHPLDKREDVYQKLWITKKNEALNFFVLSIIGIWDHIYYIFVLHYRVEWPKVQRSIDT